jgi:hypothetical protein
MAMRNVLILACLTATAQPATAQEATLRPESCARLATVQYDNCSITNIFRCGDGVAAFWIESLDADDILTVETRNADHGSETLDFVGQGVSIRMTQTKAHPRDTITNGTADDSITGEFQIFGMSRPIVGQTSYGYAGEETVLAGVTFARIAFNGSVTLPPPMPAMTGGGTYLYSEDLDLLIEESVNFDAETDGETFRLAHLSLAGQDGFGDETPGYGCGQLSQLRLNPAEIPT